MLGTVSAGITGRRCGSKCATSAVASRRPGSHRAFGARAKNHSKFHDQARQTRITAHVLVQSFTHHVFHIKILPRSLHTSKFVCIRLRVATAIWRTVIHCYCMIILLTQYVGLVWNSRSYTSICLSFDDGLYALPIVTYLYRPSLERKYRSNNRSSSNHKFSAST